MQISDKNLFSDDVEWNSIYLWKMISAYIKVKCYHQMWWFRSAGWIWSLKIKAKFVLIFSHQNYVLWLNKTFFTSNWINKINFIPYPHLKLFYICIKSSKILLQSQWSQWYEQGYCAVTVAKIQMVCHVVTHLNVHDSN